MDPGIWDTSFLRVHNKLSPLHTKSASVTNMSSDDEYKPGTVQKERDGVAATNDRGVDAEAFAEIEEKKLMRKIDWRLLPILGALYSISLIDRTNVSIFILAPLHL